MGGRPEKVNVGWIPEDGCLAIRGATGTTNLILRGGKRKATWGFFCRKGENGSQADSGTGGFGKGASDEQKKGWAFPKLFGKLKRCQPKDNQQKKTPNTKHYFKKKKKKKQKKKKNPGSHPEKGEGCTPKKRQPYNEKEKWWADPEDGELFCRSTT